MKTGKEIIRFLSAGAIVITIDFGIYYFLLHFLSYSLSKAISFTSAGFVGYSISKYWTFKNIHPSLTEIVRYTLINFLALGINVSINQGILNLLPRAIFPAVVIATASTGLFTFVCFKWWVFKAQVKSCV